MLDPPVGVEVGGREGRLVKIEGLKMFMPKL